VASPSGPIPVVVGQEPPVGNRVMDGHPDIRADEHINVLLIQNHRRNTHSLVPCRFPLLAGQRPADVGLRVPKDR
jgi:hypothetical protein